jgi:formylglycine-generating enzyme required for sulfatase activity
MWWRLVLLGVVATGVVATGLVFYWLPLPSRHSYTSPAGPDQISGQVEKRAEPPVPTGACENDARTASLSPQCASPLSAAAESSLKPKDRFKECDKCPEMVVLPAGSFTMGSPGSEPGRGVDEAPQHQVTIPKSFAVSKFDITVDQFAAFVVRTGYDAGSNCLTLEDGKPEDRQGRSWRNPGFSQEGSHPAVCLSWNDAEAYVAWLSRKTGKPYRLLTEAEWEYASRARTEPGSYPRFWFGNDEKDLCRHGNGADQTAKSSVSGIEGSTIAPCADGYAYTSPVGSFEPNDFGLYDMSGNAWQWTQDCYHDSYKGASPDGAAWTMGDCKSHVLRGGSWIDPPVNLRAAIRIWDTGDDRTSSGGFRVGRTLTP